MKKIRRIIKRIKEELRATIKISKITSVKKGLITLRAKTDIQIISRTKKKETEKIKKRLLNKHEILLEYYTKTFTKYLEEYDYTKTMKSIKNQKIKDDVIWVCWWQGIENAPEIVKKCINSIKDAAGNHNVIIITLDNYKEYIDIPSSIEQKIKKGIITLTNFSDLLRLSLLAKYGGMWLDATFYCKKGANLDKYFKYPIWSIKRPDYGHTSVACGNFGGYSLYCSSQYRWMFKVMRDFFLHYWETNDFMIDYLMIDYMIVLAQRNNKEIAGAFMEIPKNNPNCDELCKVLNDKYSKEQWEKIKLDTDLFKLTWKKDFSVNTGIDSTFYEKLLKNDL